MRKTKPVDIAEKNQMEMPNPAPAKGGRAKAVILSLFSLAIVGAMIFWFGRTDEEKEQLRERAADIVDDSLKSTPLAGLGNILRDAPPPPAINTVTEPGTLAGRDITGTVEAPVDLAGADSSLPLRDGVTGQSPGLEDELPVADDKEVRHGYLLELAQWLAARYKRGNLEISAQGLNHYCGVTLANQASGGRAGLLRYAFHPSMLEGLYRLYIGRFMDDLNHAAAKQGFSPQQKRQFYLALAGKSVLWATALEGILEVRDLKGSLAKIDKLAQKAVDVNAQLTTAVFDLDELRENKAPAQQVNVAQMRVDGLAARYRRANEEHEAAQRALVAEIRKNLGKSLDNDTLLFMAAWAERRIQSEQNARESLQSCCALLRDLGRRCAQAAGG